MTSHSISLLYNIQNISAFWLWYWRSFIEFCTSHFQRWNLHSIIEFVRGCAHALKSERMWVCVYLNLSGRFACSVDYMSVHISSTPKCMMCFHPSVRLFTCVLYIHIECELTCWYLFVHMPTNAYPVKYRFTSTHSHLIVKLHHTLLNTRTECRINCVHRIGLFHVTDMSVFLICLTSQSGLPKLHLK